jgi:hypothetical protein
LAVDQARQNSVSPQYLPNPNRNQALNNNSSPLHFNNTHSYLPWILISGEDLVIGRDS